MVAPLRRRRFEHVQTQATALTRRSFLMLSAWVQGPDNEGPPRWRPSHSSSR
ncbi:hypothetical protein [Actinomadura sp. KC345]|uniref:hypothetical protein n=1 Tax=Actinomadura sp. KC345 TaxID=2530371 RepID=UPI001404BE43|nr:hypothetical protein [Actinomadura sp. KC345]